MRTYAKILILSPHADDAIFSVGDHIARWKNRAADITVCTVFTFFLTPIVSHDARGYLNNSGFSDVGSFERARSSEDRNAMKYAGVRLINLGLTDGAFRTYEQALVYPTFSKLFSRNIPRSDYRTITKLNTFLTYIRDRYDLVVAPLGIGMHADHLIVSQCARSCIPPKKLAFYLDVPYYFFVKNWNKVHVANVLFSKKSFRWTSKSKIKIMKLYVSQLPLIIRNNKTFFFRDRFVFFPEIVLLPTGASNIFRL